jgi:hypothetical protein
MCRDQHIALRVKKKRHQVAQLRFQSRTVMHAWSPLMHSVGRRVATILHGLSRRISAGVAAVLAAVARLLISAYLLSITGRKGRIVSNGEFPAQIDSRPYQANPARLDLARFQHRIGQDSTAQQGVDTAAATVSVLTHARDHKDPICDGCCRKIRRRRRRNSAAIEPCSGNRRRR